jgi:hypothetical protein
MGEGPGIREQGAGSSFEFSNHEKRVFTMRCIAHWIFWTVTIALLLWLALSGRFNWLAVTLVVSSLVWSTVVPHTVSR